MIMIRRVVGGSMQPTLRHGQLVLVIRLRPRLGDVVVAKIDGREVVKRIVSRTDDGYDLQGDNQSASSAYASVKPAAIIGKVCWPLLSS